MSGTLSLKQQFQTFTGMVKAGDTSTPVTGGRLTGDELTFTVVGTAYTGKVNGDRIEGKTRSGAVWKAKRGS